MNMKVDSSTHVLIMLDVSLIDRSISVYQMGVWSQMMESDVEAWIMDGGLLVSKTCIII